MFKLLDIIKINKMLGSKKFLQVNVTKIQTTIPMMSVTKTNQYSNVLTHN